MHVAFAHIWEWWFIIQQPMWDSWHNKMMVKNGGSSMEVVVHSQRCKELICWWRTKDPMRYNQSRTLTWRWIWSQHVGIDPQEYEGEVGPIHKLCIRSVEEWIWSQFWWNRSIHFHVACIGILDVLEPVPVYLWCCLHEGHFDHLNFIFIKIFF